MCWICLPVNIAKCQQLEFLFFLSVSVYIVSERIRRHFVAIVSPHLSLNASVCVRVRALFFPSPVTYMCTFLLSYMFLFGFLSYQCVCSLALVWRASFLPLFSYANCISSANFWCVSIFFNFLGIKIILSHSTNCKHATSIVPSFPTLGQWSLSCYIPFLSTSVYIKNWERVYCMLTK